MIEYKDSQLFWQFDKSKTIYILPKPISLTNEELEEQISTILQDIALSKIHAATDLVGSSLGALIAMLLAIGISIKEINLKLNELDLAGWFDRKVVSLENHSLQTYTTDRFIMWAGLQVKAAVGKSMLSFKDLHEKAQHCSYYKDLHLVVLNATTQNLLLLNYKNTPKFPIILAVRICMSFATVFSVVELRTKNSRNLYLDGGLVLQHLNLGNFQEQKRRVACN